MTVTLWGNVQCKALSTPAYNVRGHMFAYTVWECLLTVHILYADKLSVRGQYLLSTS